MPMRALAFCVLLALAGAALAAPAPVDPRPTILILTDFHGQPPRGEPAWCAIVADRHPEWNVIVDADFKRLLAGTAKTDVIKKDKKVGEETWPGLLEDVDAILDKAGPVQMVIVAVGTNEARKDFYAATDAAARGRQMAQLLVRIKAHKNAAKAQRVVMTPLPVVEARLDQWSKDAFAGGQEACKAIAEAFRQAAAADGAAVLDAYAMGWDQKDDSGTPGLLLGSSGWIMRGWGHRSFAAMVEPEIVKLDPKPADADAFAAWKARRAADLRLDQALAATCEGTVAGGLPLKAVYAKGAGKTPTTTTAEVPADLLAGATLDLLLTPTDEDLAAVACGNDAFGKEVPVLRVQTDAGEVTIASPADAFRLVDEASPGALVPGDKYGANAGKWRPYPLMCKTPGQRRWLLIRFPLEALKGRKVESAAVLFYHSGFSGRMEMLVNGRPQSGPGGALGAVEIRPVIGADAQWVPTRATWKTRDGQIGWTGGAVNADARKAALQELLQDATLPAETAARAKAELSKL